tara:strand:- start:1650 stop:2060 length:411 start_codon:yes stop_codon:yes gene_type:complete
MAKPRGQGYQATEVALDVTGTIDPTGIVDTAHAAKLTSEGRYTDAAITAAGVVPGVGDAAKIAKYARMIPGSDKVTDQIDGHVDKGIKQAQEQAHGLVKPGGVAGWRAQREARASIAAEAGGPAQKHTSTMPVRRV